jgi:hypothetical protein
MIFTADALGAFSIWKPVKTSFVFHLPYMVLDWTDMRNRLVDIHNSAGLLLHECAGVELYVIPTVIGVSYQHFHLDFRMEL